MSSLFSLPWSRHRRVNQPDTASSSLRTLPSELLLMIALQLPLPDAANFALINRRLSVLIGPAYWPRLRTGAVIPEQREQFLNTFARDLSDFPNPFSPCSSRIVSVLSCSPQNNADLEKYNSPSWFYCHSCSHLHPLDRIRRPGPFDEPSNSFWCPQAYSEGSLDPYNGVGPFPCFSILFHHLQLVMRRHYLGPGYGISTDDLSFLQVNELGESELRGRRTALFSVEARVCTEPARLCLHIQRWTVLHTTVLELAVQRAKCVGVCLHHNGEESETFQLIRSSLHEYLARSEGPRGPKRRTCRRCKLVYQLEVLDTGSDGLAIVITNWLDLGSGLTPLDQKWRVLMGRTLGDDGTDHAGDAEKCRLKFEKEEGLKQHAITLRNASYLSQQQYRKTMNKIFAGVWILQAGRLRSTYDWLVILSLSLLVGGWILYCTVIGWQNTLKF